MTGFNHTLTGAIVAVVVPAPLVPLAAFVSHFICDAFPHFGNHPTITPHSRNLKNLIIADGMLCVIALLFAIWLFPDKWFVIGLGAFFACLPDFMWIFKRQLHTPQWFLRFSSWIQWGERPWGWILELLYAAIFVSLLILLS